MPYCGPDAANDYAALGDLVGGMCPVGTPLAGKPPVSSPAQAKATSGAPEPTPSAAAQPGVTSVTQPPGLYYSAQQDLRPVTFGYEFQLSGMFPTRVPVSSTVNDSSRFFDELAGRASIPSASPEDVAKFNAIKLGLQSYTGKKLDSISQLRSAFDDVVLFAAASGKDFFDVLSGTSPYVSEGASGPTSQTNTSTSTSISTPLEARALLGQWMGSLMGADPDQGEVDRFISLLNSQEQANPSVTKQTVTAKRNAQTGGTDTTSSTQTTGGVSAPAAGQIAEDYVKSQPTYAETQVSTKGLSWLQEAVMSNKRMLGA